MPGTRSTLQDALALADQLGLGTSPIDQAIGGFAALQPTPVPTAPQDDSGSLVSDVFGGVGSAFGGAADIFRDVVPQGVRDVGGEIIQSALSGERTLGHLGIDISGLPEPLQTLIDIGLAPATLIPAAAPARVLAGARAIPGIGKVAGGLLDPILNAPTFLGSSNAAALFAGRFGAELSAGIGGELVGRTIVERVPENAPFPLQLGAALSGGLLGALGGVGAFRTAESLGAILRQTSPSAAMAVEAVPEAVEAIVRSPNAKGAAASFEEFLDDPAALAQLDGTAPAMRGRLAAAANTGVPGPVTTTDPLTDKTIAQEFQALAARQGTNADDFKAMTARALDIAPETIKRRLPEFIPIQLERVMFNGWAGKSGRAQAIAVPSAGYMESENFLSLQFRPVLKSALDDSFGENYTLTSIKPTAPDEARLVWDNLSGTQRGAGQFEFIANNREHMNLTEKQLTFLDAYDEFTVNSVALHKQFTGEDLSSDATTYIMRNSDTVDAQTGDLLSPGQVDEILGRDLPGGRPIGSTRAFQMPRVFESITDAILAETGDMPRLVQLQRLRASVARAQSKLGAFKPGQRGIGDARDRVQSLEKMLKAVDENKIAFRVGNMTAEDAIVTRMIEGTKSRGEFLAKKLAEEGGPAVERDVRKILESADVGSLFSAVVTTSSTIRAGILSSDASILGVQSLGATVMGRGMGHGFEVYSRSVIGTALSPEKFSRYMLARADRVNFWGLHDSVFNTNAIGLNKFVNDDLFERPIREGLGIPGTTRKMFDTSTIARDSKGNIIKSVAGKEFRIPGRDINFAGRYVSAMNDFQFNRLAMMWKLEVNEHLFHLVKTSQSNESIAKFVAETGAKNADQLVQLANITGMARKGLTSSMTDDAIAKEISAFTNNLLGGLNRVEQGRSSLQNMIESVFLLTPGFTRGTLALALKTGSNSLEGALARDFATRGLMIAASMVSGLTMAANGIWLAAEGNPQLVTPNLTDPFASDWMDIPLPDGKTIRPFSRFRSLAQIAFNTLDANAKEGLWGAGVSLKDDSLRWLSYRQSALVSDIVGDPIGGVFGEQAGNRFARGISIGDMLINPSEDRKADALDLVQQNLPIPAQNMLESIQLNGASPGAVMDSAIILGSEFFGVTGFGPTITERSINNSAFDKSVEAGMDRDVALEMLNSNRPAWRAKDENGRHIFTSDERNRIIEEIAAEASMPVELVQRGGRRTEREREEFKEGMRQQQISAFFEGMDAADSDYDNRLNIAIDSMNAGLVSPSEFSKFLSQLRTQRASAKAAIENNNKEAIPFLRESDLRKNEKDLLFSIIAAEAFSEDFFNPNTLTFDFDRQEAKFQTLRDKYGARFDEWQARSDERKNPIERERDDAFDTLQGYFSLADQMWQSATGGLLGPTESEFDRELLINFRQQGVPEGQAQLLLSQIKQQIPAIRQAHSLTNKSRAMLRLIDAEVDAAAQKWLGNQPVDVAGLR